ncbi:MAG: Holliday junction resolvase RuvX [Abitibacteriaceae bacterium]|nr:Holliday junction resolvase RuvX [Abditibacteriaceae bacterium]
MRYLAIDFGERRIGLAVSDDTGTFASPLATRERKGRRQDLDALLETFRGVGAERMVVGLPRSLAGNAGAGEEALRKFVDALQQALRTARLPAEVEWWDERFSTREALTHMRAAGISQRQGRATTGAGSVDARAAAIILQGFLDFQKAQAERSSPVGEDEHEEVAEINTDAGDLF